MCIASREVVVSALIFQKQSWMLELQPIGHKKESVSEETTPVEGMS